MTNNREWVDSVMNAMSVRVSLTGPQWRQLSRMVHRFVSFHDGPMRDMRALFRAVDKVDEATFRFAGRVDGPLSLTVPAPVLSAWLDMTGYSDRFDVWWVYTGDEEFGGLWDALGAAFGRVEKRAVKVVEKTRGPVEPTAV